MTSGTDLVAKEKCHHLPKHITRLELGNVFSMPAQKEEFNLCIQVLSQGYNWKT